MTGALGGVLAAAQAAPARGPGDGRIVMLVAARPGEGVSTVARDAAAGAGAPVLLVDLDVKRNPQARFYETSASLGAPGDGAINGASFVRVVTAQGATVRAGALAFRRVAQTNVHVSQWSAGALPSGARVQIAADGAYWAALRASGALVVVDAPAIQKSGLALKLAKHMDAVVLVVAGNAGAAPPAMAARAALTEAGAHVAGLVFARAATEAVMIDRMTRQAG